MLTTKRPQRAASSIFVAALIATACGDPTERPGAPTGDTARADLRIVAVTHGVSADPFWSVVINGLDDAVRDLGVRVLPSPYSNSLRAPCLTYVGREG